MRNCSLFSTSDATAADIFTIHSGGKGEIAYHELVLQHSFNSLLKLNSHFRDAKLVSEDIFKADHQSNFYLGNPKRQRGKLLLQI